MSFTTALYIILLVLNLVNVCLHCAGLILICLSARRIIQHIYLLNLSLSVAIINLAELLRTVFVFSATTRNATTLHHIRLYIHTASFTGVRFFYFMDMIIITLDRLLLNLLTLRYKKLWNRRKARKLVWITWTVGFCTSCISCVGQYFDWFDWQNIFQTFVYPVLDLLFIVLAIGEYVLVRRKNGMISYLVRFNSTILGPDRSLW